MLEQPRAHAPRLVRVRHGLGLGLGLGLGYGVGVREACAAPRHVGGQAPRARVHLVRGRVGVRVKG